MASPLNRPGLRAAAASAALTLVALSANVPAAQAIPPPSVDPAMVPADARPGPDQPMRRSNSCSTPITVRNPDVAQLAPGFNLVNISKAWQYSTGNGVPVAVIDTGVSPNPRLAGGARWRLHHGGGRPIGLRRARHGGEFDHCRCTAWDFTDAKGHAGHRGVPTAGRAAAGHRRAGAAGRSPAPDAPAAAGDDHPNRCATATTTRGCGRHGAVQWTAGSANRRRTRGAPTPAGRPGRGGGGGPACDHHLDSAVLAGLRAGQPVVGGSQLR